MRKIIIGSLALLLITSGAVLAQDGMRQLRVNFYWPTYIDPAVGNDFSSSSSLINIYDTLVFPNVEGGMDPWVAESWEVSDDSLTYTFHLRQGVLFHDGSELLASDVAYSFNRMMEISQGFSYLMPKAEVAVLDDHTVQFTLQQRDPLAVSKLVRLFILNEDLVRANYAEGNYGEHGDYGREWLLTNDAGSGPYRVVDFPLAEYLDMERFDDYWNNNTFLESAPDTVRFLGTTAAATIRSLMLEGELEISDAWQSYELLEELQSRDGLSVKAFPTITSFYFMMNTRLAPLDDVHCRRALSYAYDYDQISAIVWPGTQTMVGPVPRTVRGHNPDVTTYSRDLDKAREELALCKYADNIADYPIDIVWVDGVSWEEPLALLFQANMAEIGIPVNVIALPWLSVIDVTSSLESSPHIVTILVSTDLPEAGLMLQQRYGSDTAMDWQQNEWLLDPELDAAFDDALLTVDDEERYAKYRDLQEQIVDMAPSIFVLDQLETHAYADYVDWRPEESSPIMGYQFFVPHIGINQ